LAIPSRPLFTESLQNSMNFYRISMNLMDE
jgi:hypothetical protein